MSRVTVPRKRSSFVILVREDDGRVYCVRNSRGELGVPGGKGEPSDADDFAIAAREFAEETGGPLPDGSAGLAAYTYVAYGERHHNCAFFVRRLRRGAAEALPVGASPDHGAEAEVLWADVHQEWRELRRHVRDGLVMAQVREPLLLPPHRRRPAQKSRPFRAAAADALFPAFRGLKI